jgi:uncharacterized Ntn-hydrolase superfamily protein
MKRLALCLLVLSAAASSQRRPDHTFSIVARDPQTGEIGVAVQTHWFAVGSRVPWAEAGVGAVATQSFTDPSYGKLGLDLMRAGKSAPDALNALLISDQGQNVRQVGMVDATGIAVAWTGANNIQSAGHLAGGVPEIRSGCGYGFFGGSPGNQTRIINPCLTLKGRDFAVQANLMLNDKVWPAMAKAYEEAKGDLADRMLAALDAGQAAGGDIRGRQSAALIVVKAKSSGKPWNDRIFDLRVDDHLEPLKELRRLLTLQRAYNHMNAGDDAVERKDNDTALREYAAAEKLVEGQPNIDKSRLAEMKFWHAVALVTMNRVEESLPLFKQAFALEPNWRVLTPRLPKSGLLPDDTKLIERVTSQ